MKTREEIERRLSKLRSRYEARFIESAVSRIPGNCQYNYIEQNVDIKSDIDVEHELAPRISTTLVIIQPPKAVRLCMLGASTMNQWNGTICDSSEMSSKCKYFTPKKSISNLQADFQDILSDDQRTLAQYPDVAALQWVVQDRVYSKPTGVLHRFRVFIYRCLRRIGL